MQTETLVLKNATIIDGTGCDPLGDGWVVVQGDRIREMGTGTPGALPPGATQIDCKGGTLLPGLIDAHVHMGAVEADLVEQQRRNSFSMLVIRSLGILKDTLDQGFTTVRDCGGIDPGFRQAVDQGLIPGPRLLVCGAPLSQTGGHGDFRLATEKQAPAAFHTGLHCQVCDGVDEVRRAAREQLRQGVDHIKVMAGGGAMSPADKIDTCQYSLDELRAANFEARAAGTYVAAHVYSVRGIKNCITAGIRSIEHGNLLDEAAAAAMAVAGAFFVPTMSTYEIIPRMADRLGIPAVYVDKIVQCRDQSMNALRIASKAGVKIASGSDLLGPMQVYKAVELELKAKVLSPMGAIVAATRTNAELLHREEDLGTVAPGKLADLIVVDGDPLKDISLFQRYQEKIPLIVKGGVVYKNTLL